MRFRSRRSPSRGSTTACRDHIPITSVQFPMYAGLRCSTIMIDPFNTTGMRDSRNRNACTPPTEAATTMRSRPCDAAGASRLFAVVIVLSVQIEPGTLQPLDQRADGGRLHFGLPGPLLVRRRAVAMVGQRLQLAQERAELVH